MAATVTYQLETIQTEFRANTYTSGNQLAPDVLGLSNGGYVVAYNNDPLSYGFILLNFYDANGAPLGGYRIPYDGDTNAAGAPTLTQMTNGNVVVIWPEHDGADGLRGAIFTPEGVSVGDEFVVSLGFDTSDAAPQVTALTGGGFVVTKQFTDDIVIEIFDENGNSISSELSIATTAGANSEPVVTGLADGGFVVTWTHDNGTDFDLRARIFEADGTPREVDGSFDDFPVATFANSSQPAITALPNGNWAVAHTDGRWAEDDVGITLMIYGPDDGFLNITHVNIASDPFDESDPDITVLDNGFIVVSWTYPLGVGGDVYCRIFDQSGNPITVDGFGPEIVLDSSGFSAVESTISGILSGQFVAAWKDSDSDGSDGRITATVKELVRTTTGDGASETLSGDALRDVMLGNGGHDTLNAGDGDDTLDGGAGNDTLNGGAGRDTATYATATSSVVVSLALAGAQNTGGSGNDTLSSIENLVGSNFADTLSGTAGDNIISGGGSDDDVKGYAGNDVLNGEAGDDTLNGGATNDTLNGGDNDDTLIGQDGNDALNGGNGIDTASYVGAVTGVTVALATTTAQNTGGDGTDTLSSIESLIGSNFVDTLSGTAGDNTISGGGSNDTLTGYAGNDILNGDNGNDTLNGGATNDTLSGGENNDTLIGQDGNDTLAGGNGTDTASYVGAIAGVTVALSVAAAQNTVGDGTDTLSSIENLIGSGFADTLSGTSSINTISGGGNNDTLTGYAGNDILNGDNGDDTLNGGANNDTLSGGENNDTLIGQDGNDTLNGGNGTDTASYVGAVAGVTVALHLAGAQNTGGDGTDTLSSIENLIGSGTGDTLSGTSGINTLTGNGGDDSLTGYAGNDVLNGDNGDDTLNGGASNDTLNGGGNNDTLIGQDSNDTLTGGSGADDFFFDDGHGADTVTDFQNGSDQFDLSAVAGVDDIGDLTIIDNGATVTVNYGSGSFTIANLPDPGQLDASDFLF